MEEKKEEKKEITLSDYIWHYQRRLSNKENEGIADVRNIIADAWIQTELYKQRDFDKMSTEAKERIDLQLKTCKEIYNAIISFKKLFRWP